jgi:hypothetical protein
MPAPRSRTGDGATNGRRDRAVAVGAKPAVEPASHGKRVTFDAETWQALELLRRDSMKDFQELADEAFRDLLRKHGRPTDLKTALRRSAAAADDDKAKGQRRAGGTKGRSA